MERNYSGLKLSNCTYLHVDTYLYPLKWVRQFCYHGWNGIICSRQFWCGADISVPAWNALYHNYTGKKICTFSAHACFWGKHEMLYHPSSIVSCHCMKNDICESLYAFALKESNAKLKIKSQKMFFGKRQIFSPLRGLNDRAGSKLGMESANLLKIRALTMTS